MIEKRTKRVKIQYRIRRCSKGYSSSSIQNRPILPFPVFYGGLFFLVTQELYIFIQFSRIFFCEDLKLSRCLSTRRLGSIQGRST
jgi:hypothetical protein